MKEKSESALKRFFGRSELTVLVAVLILGTIFSVFSNNFLSAYNIYTLSRTAALYMFVALSQTMVIIVGGMNLSLGYIGGMSVVAVGFCMQNLHTSAAVAVIAALAIGLLAGAFNGIVITRLKINSFIVTLATSFIYQGLITGISEGFPYTQLSPNFTWLGRGRFLGLPLMLFFAILVLLAIWFVFRYTVTGRRLLATGGNEVAARMAAVNTDRSVVIANVLSGLFAAIAGICAVSMNGSAQPTTGSDWMIYSFAVSVIGGTALAGGVIQPLGIFIAAYLIVMIKNGLVMINANIYFEQTYLGLILLLAVSLSSISRAINELKRRHKFRSRNQ